MKLPVYVKFHGMGPSEALTGAVKACAHELESVDPEIIACWVSIRLEKEHERQVRPYSVRIDLKIPGHELVVKRVQHEDVYIAMLDAFKDMKIQLQDVVRREHETKYATTIQGQLTDLDDSANGRSQGGQR